jgi:hypothetical protein
MLKSLPIQLRKTLLAFGVAIVLSSGFVIVGRSQGNAVQTTQGTAVQLINEGSAYQTADDTNDRAAIAYRLVIQKYPRSLQAEQAQYFLGTYYEKKFFLLEGQSKLEDWSSFNEAEKALYGYVGKYKSSGTKSYLADSYYTLAIIALRRGYGDAAKKLLAQMSDSAKQDNKVYLSKVAPRRYDEVIKKYCDTKSLAAATLNALNNSSSFDGAIKNLTGWSRTNCR